MSLQKKKCFEVRDYAGTPALVNPRQFPFKLSKGPGVPQDAPNCLDVSHTTGLGPAVMISGAAPKLARFPTRTLQMCTILRLHNVEPRCPRPRPSARIPVCR